jgi:hypothetical protein
MDKPIIIRLLTYKYGLFVDFVAGLNAEDYAFSYNGKWTAGQQLEHIVLCVKPLVQVYGMPPAMIAQNFGTSDQGSRDYGTLVQDYVLKLHEGGQAPTRFVPVADAPALSREELLATLKQLVLDLSDKINALSEADLDTYCIPHPLLGKITLREMLFNAIYHVQHHQTVAEENLQQR